MTNLSNDYWLRRDTWERAVADQFRQDFPEFAHHNITVCKNGTVFVRLNANTTPGAFKGYPAWTEDDPTPFQGTPRR